MVNRLLKVWCVWVAVLAVLLPATAFADEVMPPDAQEGAGEIAAVEPSTPIVDVSVPAIARFKSPAGALAVVKVEAPSDVMGFQVRIATNKALTKNAKSTTSSKPTVTFKKLKQGKKYYAKARAYLVKDGITTWSKWSPVKSVIVKWKPVWQKKGGYYAYRKANGKLARGLTRIGKKTYLFDSSGFQKTGWQRVKGVYRFFNVDNKAGGYMAKNRIVNGIKLNKLGVAQPSASGAAELSIMCKAQKLAEGLTYPAQSRTEKLKRGFYYLKNDCVESLTRNFSYYQNWHRAFALDVYDHKTGSCFSYGAALAYFANAIGYQSCVIVSSGGHGWAEIDGKVYDAEWSRHCSRDLFAVSYSESGSGGVPAYAASRAYTMEIAPRKSQW